MDSRIGAYQARDAQWLRRYPLLVGRDYDFTMALGLDDGVGAALAALHRRQHNQAAAQQLEGLSAVSHDQLLDVIGRRCGWANTNRAPPRRLCPELARARGAWAYGVLFGADTARLRVVLELLLADGDRRQYVSVGRPRRLIEFGTGTELRDDFIAGAENVGQLLGFAHGDPSGGGRARCEVGGKESAPGLVLARRGASTVLRLTDTQLLQTMLSCPGEALRPMDQHEPS
jgi:hypothetical protein